MSAVVEGLEELRARANVEGRAASIEQFRDDFKLVWAHWRASGELTQDEFQAGYQEGAAAVQDHMSDPQWMASAAAHFASMAEQIKSDRTRSTRIAAEVRAEREMSKRRVA